MAKNAGSSKIAVNLPRALHTAVRRKAFDERKTWETVVCEALGLWLGGEGVVSDDSVGSKLTNGSDGSVVSFSASEPDVVAPVKQLSMRDLLAEAEKKVETEPVESVTPIEIVRGDWFPAPPLIPWEGKKPQEELEGLVSEALEEPTDTVIENEKPQEVAPSDDDLLAGLFDDL